MLSTYVLVYTPEWGKTSPYAPKYGMSLKVEDGKITKASANPLEIPQNGYVISGPKSVLQPLLEKKDANLTVNTNPEWKNVKHIISGGPYLVKDNEVYVDMTAQKLGAIGGRNPRSAIGYTADNNLVLVAVDGREGSSIGMTLMELGNFMKSIGCTNAINLDGGGSTVMYVKGNVVNHPAQRGGIPLSNAIVLSELQ
jgi:exopolysaccharide biosynthesis protein